MVQTCDTIIKYYLLTYLLTISEIILLCSYNAFYLQLLIMLQRGCLVSPELSVISLDGEEGAGCFALFVFLVSCDCCVALPHSEIDR